jgi:hypothetical protein
MKLPTNVLFATCAAVVPAVVHGAILFDFENAPHRSPLPIDLTVDGVTAHFAATGEGFSVQRADTMGFTPQGFSGLCLYPSSVFRADLLITFSQPLTDFSVLYAPQELATDSSATMRATGYLDAGQVATNTASAAEPGTWPSATLSLRSDSPFNRVVVHYESPPPTGGDWGPIFMADNVTVTPLPEAGGVAAIIPAALCAAALARRRR